MYALRVTREAKTVKTPKKLGGADRLRQDNRPVQGLSHCELRSEVLNDQGLNDLNAK